ncbi:MAG: LacI family transcriptional regulator [Planctomycetes bacterium]|nr:LacI family transcriptional regulator [Planctomycetota bacterium]
MPATLHDLARACLCNVSTVSRALRDDPRISPEMRAKVAAAAAELGYRPNLAARALVTGRSGTVWFLLGELSSPVNHQPAEAAARLCRDHGLDLLVATHHGDRTAHRRLLERLRQGVAEGALIAASELDQESAELRELAASGFPLVFIDRHLPDLEAPAATTDHAGAVTALVALLAERGFATVVGLHQPGRNSVDHARTQALEAACRTQGLRLLPPQAPLDERTAVMASGAFQVVDWLAASPGRQPAAIAIHDRWPGQPPAGCLVLELEQDFAAMAAAAWRLLTARLGGAPPSSAVMQVPHRAVHIIPPRS